MPRVPRKSVEEALADHRGSLMALPGVVGAAIGRCGTDPCIRVFLAEDDPEARRAVPDRIEGYEVRVEVTGSFGARGP